MNVTMIIDRIESMFQERFETKTMSRINGYQLHSLAKESNDTVTLYTFDMSSDTPYRYTTIRVQICDDANATLGHAGSMDMMCRSLEEDIIKLFDDNNIKFTTYAIWGK